MHLGLVKASTMVLCFSVFPIANSRPLPSQIHRAVQRITHDHAAHRQPFVVMLNKFEDGSRFFFVVTGDAATGNDPACTRSIVSAASSASPQHCQNTHQSFRASTCNCSIIGRSCNRRRCQSRIPRAEISLSPSSQRSQ